MFKLEKNIPVPVKASKLSKYPFQEMEAGDSFFVPKGTSKSVLAAAAGFRRKHDRNKKFTARDIDGGCRCWRTK